MCKAVINAGISMFITIITHTHMTIERFGILLWFTKLIRIQQQYSFIFSIVVDHAYTVLLIRIQQHYSSVHFIVVDHAHNILIRIQRQYPFVFSIYCG
jgi:hypothetical protein